MENKLSVALERRLKTIPNKATVGVQAQVNDWKLHIPKFKKINMKYPSLSVATYSEEIRFKDEKVGTDPIVKVREKTPPKTATRNILRFRLRGVLSENSKDIETLKSTNRQLKLQLRKEKHSLINQM